MLIPSTAQHSSALLLMSLIFQQGASSSSLGLVSSLVARWSFHRQLVGVSPWIGTSVRIEESAANHSHPGWTISQYMHRPPSLHSQYNTPSSYQYREPWPGGGRSAWPRRQDSQGLPRLSSAAALPVAGWGSGLWSNHCTLHYTTLESRV